MNTHQHRAVVAASAPSTDVCQEQCGGEGRSAAWPGWLLEEEGALEQHRHEHELARWYLTHTQSRNQVIFARTDFHINLSRLTRMLSGFDTPGSPFLFVPVIGTLRPSHPLIPSLPLLFLHKKKNVNFISMYI